MQFKDSVNKTGLVEDADFLCGTDDVSYPLVDKARNANRWVYKTQIDIIKTDKRWLFDDSNHTDLPIFEGTFVVDQNDYTIPDGVMNLEAVEVKDQNGNWHRIDHINKDIMKRTISDFETTSGRPEFYDTFGETIWFEPAPSSTDVTLSNGYRLHTTRDINHFTAADTTQEPGFVEAFHRIVSLGMSYDWLLVNGSQERTSAVRQELEQLRTECRQWYGERNIDIKTGFQPKSVGSQQYT